MTEHLRCGVSGKRNLLSRAFLLRRKMCKVHAWTGGGLAPVTNPFHEDSLLLLSLSLHDNRASRRPHFCLCCFGSQSTRMLGRPWHCGRIALPRMHFKSDLSRGPPSSSYKIWKTSVGVCAEAPIDSQGCTVFHPGGETPGASVHWAHSLSAHSAEKPCLSKGEHTDLCCHGT